MKEKKPEGYDQIIQMQLTEFQRHIMSATCADIGITIIETNGIAQCASGSNTMSEAEGRLRATILMMQVAAAMIDDASDGKHELCLHNKETKEMARVGDGLESHVIKV